MFLDVHGVRLHAVSFGAGDRTILAVGGWTGSWEMWEGPLSSLSIDGWRCIAFDHRGSGESPVEPNLITVQNMVDDIIGALDQLSIESCVLAGESSGGAIAQLAAAQYPDRIIGLILVDSAATDKAERVPSAFAAACRNNYPAAVHAFVDRCVPEADSDHIRRWGRNLLLRAEPEQAARLIEMWQDDDVPVIDKRKITQPTLIIHGTEDVIVPIESSRALQALIPNSELVELSGCGHVPTMTRPAEVYEAISRFFYLPK
jgi:pimeloyl-ACP methyl ester carboxylesterase